MAEPPLEEMALVKDHLAEVFLNNTHSPFWKALKLNLILIK